MLVFLKFHWLIPSLISLQFNAILSTLNNAELYWNRLSQGTSLMSFNSWLCSHFDSITKLNAKNCVIHNTPCRRDRYTCCYQMHNFYHFCLCLMVNYRFLLVWVFPFLSFLFVLYGHLYIASHLCEDLHFYHFVHIAWSITVDV